MAPPPKLQRSVFPGMRDSFLSRLVDFLKKRNRTYFLLDVSKGEIKTDLWETKWPTLVEWQ